MTDSFRMSPKKYDQNYANDNFEVANSNFSRLRNQEDGNGLIMYPIALRNWIFCSLVEIFSS